MWGLRSLFGDNGFPDHHAAVHTDAHGVPANHAYNVGEHFSHAGRAFAQDMRETLWAEPAELCSVCHAELQPHEHVRGCCDDRDSCAWRALSERCCW